MFKKIDHTEILCGDFEKTIGFYLDVLGFKLRERRKIDMPPLQEIAYLELNGTVVELIAAKDVTPVSSDPWQVQYRMIALEVDDMDKALEYLKGKGIKLSWGPTVTGTSKRAEIKDPNGLSIELRQW